MDRRFENNGWWVQDVGDEDDVALEADEKLMLFISSLETNPYWTE